MINMKRILQILLLALGIASCKKETVVNDFIAFGELKIDNATVYSSLHAQLTGNEKLLGMSENIKLVPGPNQLKIWGATSDPKDKPVPIFDSLLQVESYQLYRFILFQPSLDLKPVVVKNNQAAEPKPAAGFMKVKVANFASHCFNGPVDLLIRIVDNRTEDFADLDTVKQVPMAFGGYVLCKGIDPAISDGFTVFQLFDPVTHESLYNDIIFSVHFMNNATKQLYTVATLYMIEREDSRGLITGTDGKKYFLEVKALFMD